MILICHRPLFLGAAANELPLNDMLVRLASLYDGQASTLFLHDYRNNRLRFSLTEELNESELTSYRSYDSSVNPWVQAQKVIAAGTVVLSRDLVPERDFLRSEFYSDFFKA